MKVLAVRARTFIEYLVNRNWGPSGARGPPGAGGLVVPRGLLVPGGLLVSGGFGFIGLGNHPKLTGNSRSQDLLRAINIFCNSPPQNLLHGQIYLIPPPLKTGPAPKYIWQFPSSKFAPVDIYIYIYGNPPPAKFAPGFMTPST